MSDWTPGPLAVRIAPGADGYIVAPDGGEATAYVDRLGDALLYAAAPEMAELLERFASLGRPNGIDYVRDSDICAARALLAKVNAESE